MKILFYGRLGELVGRETEVDLPQDCRTVADLKQLLANAHPHASDALTVHALRACVDDNVVGEDFPLNASQTVEFFPPLSGG